jgi:hypothetical protein
MTKQLTLPEPTELPEDPFFGPDCDSREQTAKLKPSDREADRREIQRLRRELTEDVEEREILKKVVGIFSRKST